MLENKLLISFIISSVITGIYHFLYRNNEEDNKDNRDIGFYLIIFIFSLIIIYLAQIGYLPDKKSGGSNNDVGLSSDRHNFKPPF